MEEIFLDIELRQELGKAKAKDLREKGFIPAVVYGAGKRSSVIKVSRSQLLKLLHQHRLENVVINLRSNTARDNPSISTKGGPQAHSTKTSKGIKDEQGHKSRPCLIKEIQYDPIGDDIIHVDFNEISLTKVIKVSVPVVAKGEPVGVKLEGGSLEHILWEIELECLPADIPPQIEVDVSQLKTGEAIHIKDITPPPKVKILNDPEAIVLSVALPLKEEVVAMPVEGEEKQEPEVIKEKKEAPEAVTEEEGKKEK